LSPRYDAHLTDAQSYPRAIFPRGGIVKSLLLIRLISPWPLLLILVVYYFQANKMSEKVNGANIHARSTVNRVSRKNDKDNGRSVSLILAHLAVVAVQHKEAKQGNYDALLYFFGGLDNAADVQHS
jgi:hypothetical protein